MQQKFRMFLYIIRPIGIRVKICDYVNQNTAHSRGIDLSERTVLEMSVITKAGLLALAAVLLLPSAQTTQAAQPEPLIVIVQKRQDAQERTLRVLRDGSVEEAALDTYLAQVVLSEMPASFAPEALKAQAVAARTFACRQTAGGKHENADVCAQSACCQACLTVEDLRARYGDGFEAAWDKALAAVRETQNEVLTYEGALIDAVYFSCSGGSTEDAAAVWGTDVPYLRAVESPGEQDAAKYESRVCVTAETFAETLRALDASVQLSGDPSGWVQSVTRTPGGGRRHAHSGRPVILRRSAAKGLRAELHALYASVRGRRVQLRRPRLRPPRRHEPIRRRRHRPPRLRLSDDPALLLPGRGTHNA